MKYITSLGSSWLLCFLLVSCLPTSLQTVETGELFLPEQDPKYKFERNQESSVNIQEPELTFEVLQELRERYISEAYIRNEEQLNEAYLLLFNGRYGYAPLPRIAASASQQSKAESIVKDIKDLIYTTAKISGMGADNPNQHRRREASRGQSGYVATSASSKLRFVDAQGLAIAEVLDGYLLGAIAIDQVLGVHLDEAVVANSSLIAEHESQKLFEGNNYTELEHHWDRAYGYYLHGLRQLSVANGIVALRGTTRLLDLTFTLGRIDLNYHLYDQLSKHVQTIRRELSRMLLIRIEYLLLGGNTLANLKEEPQFAFTMLSEAYGLIYALQFLRNRLGTPYFSYEEVRQLQRDLLGEQGFWDTEHLLGTANASGSLQRVVQQIRERINSK